jgi:hypothetical protein
MTLGFLQKMDRPVARDLLFPTLRRRTKTAAFPELAWKSPGSELFESPKIPRRKRRIQ